MDTSRWQLETVRLTASGKLSHLLDDGWEPFAIDDGQIYLRRAHALADADPLRRRRLSGLAG
jgi:hypothetical protein